MSQSLSLATSPRQLRSNLQWMRESATSIQRVLRKSPCTLQTILLTFFIAYLLVGPVPQSADIVCASIAWGLLAIMGFIVVTTTIHSLLIKKKLRVELTPPSDEVLAGESEKCVITIPALKLLPGTFLECSLTFTQDGATQERVRLHGSWNRERRLAITTTFPHRGAWEIGGIRCTLADITGFTSVSWSIPHQTSVVVAPAIPLNTELPLVSSTQRSGDLAPDTIHRYGDPFDIKPYHPSDGIKKIVWKAFAKSGELLSRHPEPSMTPEGFVAICILARTHEDNVCGKALAYIQALKELSLEVLVGCEGHNGRPLAHDAPSSKTLIIDSAWDSLRSSTGSLLSDVQSVVDACARSEAHITLRKMVIFCAGSRFTKADDVDLVVSLGTWLEGRGVEPVFFLAAPEQLHDSGPSRVQAKIRSLLIQPDPNEQRAQEAGHYQRFLSTCLSRQWEIVV
jgi:hypothetical protein